MNRGDSKVLSLLIFKTDSNQCLVFTIILYVVHLRKIDISSLDSISVCLVIYYLSNNVLIIHKDRLYD